MENSLPFNFVTEIELLSWPSITPKLHKVITNFIKDVLYLNYSYRVKQTTILLRQKFNLELGDAFIAATALEYDMLLVSADKVFSRVPDLHLITFIPSN